MVNLAASQYKFSTMWKMPIIHSNPIQRIIRLVVISVRCLNGCTVKMYRSIAMENTENSDINMKVSAEIRKTFCNFPEDAHCIDKNTHTIKSDMARLVT